MKQKLQQIFLQLPNSKLQTLTLDSTQILTLHDLKLSLFPNNHQNLSSFFFTLNGKPLLDSTPIPNPQITSLSTLVLHSRLPGGGGDGGATGAESRDCYLNMYAEKKPDKVDPNEQRLSKWLNCALSNEPLMQPCVIDKLGNVFNKEALVEALIGKKLPKEFGYIKGLKDMINIKLEPIPGEKEELYGAKFHCPISGLEFNGKYKFYALKNCGHVLSAKALKEVKSSACLVCYKEFEEFDKIVINGSDEEVADLRERLEEERLKVKDKKSKKVKKGEVGVNGGDDCVDLDTSRLIGKKHGISDDKGVEKVVSKVVGSGKVEKVKGVGNGGAVKKFKAADMAPANATKEVYASIFTSSKKSDFKETYMCRSLPLGRN
ncbi:replication termination factor 2 [Ricinus communis]|uniref:replication termination factor 2 n=1 Tax=Ricinus communis TaxID=3988 RepID=UPI00201A8A81|nr:replication termination factor 2 [Ricinus communis]